MFWFFGQEACGILAPQLGIELAPSALKGKSPGQFYSRRNAGYKEVDGIIGRGGGKNTSKRKLKNRKKKKKGRICICILIYSL